MRATALDPRNHGLVLGTRLALLFGCLFLWWALTTTGVLSTFFFGDPVGVARRLWIWFSTGSVFVHLYTTLIETILAFIIGTVLGLWIGLWLALNPFMAS